MTLARGSAGAATLAATVLLVAAAVAEEGPSGTLLQEDSSGVLRLEGESRLLVRGMSGTFSVRAGPPGELGFEARSLDNRRTPRPVALWAEDRTLSLEPVEGDDGSATLIEIVVPAELAVDVETHDSLVQASALGGRLRITGQAVDVAARGLEGAAQLDVTGGKILVSGIQDELELRGSGLEARIEYAAGYVFVSLKESRLDVASCGAAIEGEVEKTTVTGLKLQGPVELDADDSELSFEGAVGGGVFNLGATPLSLARTQGAFDVTTDAAVDFSQHDGELKILGYGAAVHGANSLGQLEIETDGAEVRLEQLEGTTAVSGRDLEVWVQNPKGEVAVRATISKIVVKKSSASLVLENEYGDIEVEESLESVDVNIRDGEARLTGLKGPLHLTSEGGEVNVRWVAMTSEEDSSIEAGSGDVRLVLPATVNLRVDAESSGGRIEADGLPGVRVGGDGQSASGFVGPSRATAQARRPTLRVRSAGDVYLAAAAGGRQ